MQLRKEGENALLITDTLRIEAFDCFKLLKPYGASLKDAVRFYIAHHEAASKSCTVEAAVDEYLKIQRLKRRSERHIADLKYKLGVFKERFGTMVISSLSVHDSENRLHGLRQSPKSLNNFYIAVSALLSILIALAVVLVIFPRSSDARITPRVTIP